MALSLVLVYKVVDIVNFAQGEVAMFSTFISFALLRTYDTPLPIAAIAAIVSAAVISVVAERVTIRPVLDRPEAHAIIVTVGLFLILNAGAGGVFGSDPQGYPSLVTIAPIRVGNVTIPPDELVIIVVVSILMAGLWALFKFTRLGVAMRATQQSHRAARLMGIEVGRIFSLTWALAGVLAALTGMLIAPITGLSPQMMVPMLLNGLAAAVIGGFGSIVGAVIGGLLLGLSETLIGAYISLNLQEAVTFGAIILMLIVRPQGLFPGTHRRKV
jgi:branched-chain amino acid transport system permease protein